MGGFGSERPGGRSKVEHYWSIDANRLGKVGVLRDGYCGGWRWTRNGDQVADIRLSVSLAVLTLHYRFRRYEEDWEAVDEPVRLSRVACNLGGERTYFQCLGVRAGRVCGRRVVKLYGASTYFLCRHCYGLAYASQSEASPDRVFRRANKLKTALGGEPGLSSSPPRRPKGMWRRTYERRIEEVFAAEDEAEAAFASEAMRRFGMIF